MFLGFKVETNNGVIDGDDVRNDDDDDVNVYDVLFVSGWLNCVASSVVLTFRLKVILNKCFTFRF